MIKPEQIHLYPMNDDVYGRRTHAQYVDDMATLFVRIVTGYRIDYDVQRQLIQYAEENHEKLNR